MKTVRVDTSEPGLFGNDAAEDETSEVFNAYVLDRPEAELFGDPSVRFQIVRAYKGEGKSALLRLVRSRLDAAAEVSNAIVLATTGHSLSPSLDSLESDHWVREWKRSLFRYIASEIGSRIGMAWSDDTISLVEAAERDGFKSRSVVSAITDRLKLKDAPVERSRLTNENHERLLSRWSKGNTPVWVFIDDVDQNFKNESGTKVRIASFFTACRQVVNQVPDVRLRVAIRPNVWTLLKYEFEALSHVEQYVQDLSWKEDQMRHLIARRIEGHLRRTGAGAFVDGLRPGPITQEQLISLVFESSMPWGKGTRPPHVVLTTLSRRRPRWLIELCKAATARARFERHNVVSLGHISSQLLELGRRRIADTVAEFKSQCPQVEELLAAFAQQAEDYKTDELMTLIRQRALPGLPITIAGVVGNVAPRDVAAFLFEIGFLTARRDRPDGGYEHLSYADEPALLHARSNMDQGVSWEIHPIFRQVLGLRDARGRETRPRR